MSKIMIVGAGLSGLIAGSMLRDSAFVIEASPEVPNNHKALLRFRSTAVSDAVGIPFKEVKVHKAIHRYFDNEVANGMAYGHKCTGKHIMRSMKEETGTRYIAPENLVEQLANQLQASVSLNLDSPIGMEITEWDGPVISTMPLPLLLPLVYQEKEAKKMIDELGFLSIPGFTARLWLPNTHAYVTVYDTDPKMPFYRYSITGDKLIMEASNLLGLTQSEFAEKSSAIKLSRIEERLGLDSGLIWRRTSEIQFSESQYQKIAPIPEKRRQEILMELTQQFNIYSLGRFATWRPGLLLDDIVQDVRRIQSMINGDNSLIYQRRKA